MEHPTQAIFHNAVFLAGSFSGAGPRKRARVEKPKKPAKEQRDITKMSAAEKKKEIARLRAAIKEEELKRKREKVAALEASIMADEADDKLMTEE
ncbi:hypothetical protein ASPTUDRAFT_191235 [Aspergillus tubingensis CBS 134.48]|uniref:Uncharacterized protein n=1 Tax=Aspergillus tubingensis (strain CBS 134.48) TaxID=767770 RepID=A0A1L9N0B4_ASPTC|nr:hypothetical protein ASPTUDRAFT_191235 [Aspergillus tubingensis CBS 134.48]